jgi:hypothetical protein
MSAPQPAPSEVGEDGDEEPHPDEAFDEPQEAPFDGVEEPDVELAEVDIGEPVDEGDGDDAFDGVEDEDVGGGGAGGFDGVDKEPGEDWGAPSGPDSTEAIAESINQGAARAAVIGLQDEFEVNGETQTKDDLREEFEEVFEVANLGTFGAQSAEKYLRVEGEVDPLMGFAASLLACTALVLWMRPDGDEVIGRVSERVQHIKIPGQQFP